MCMLLCLVRSYLCVARMRIKLFFSLSSLVILLCMCEPMHVVRLDYVSASFFAPNLQSIDFCQVTVFRVLQHWCSVCERDLD